MAEIADADLTMIVEEAFAAGQEVMRGRAAFHAFNLIGLETAGKEMQLARRVGDYLSEMKPMTMAEHKAKRQGDGLAKAQSSEDV